MNDVPIFCKPYKYSKVERKLIKVRTKELLMPNL